MLVSLAFVGVLCAAFCGATSPPDEIEIDCEPPFWHGQLGDNWPLAGVSRKTQPKFNLVVRKLGTNNTITPGETYNVILGVNRPGKPTSKRIHGFVLDLIKSPGESADCGKGKFTLKRGKRVTKATATDGCDNVFFDGKTDVTRTRGIRWIAPKCGCVIISATVRDADNRIYHDDIANPEIEAKYKRLVKVICAAKTEA